MTKSKPKLGTKAHLAATAKAATERARKSSIKLIEKRIAEQDGGTYKDTNAAKSLKATKRKVASAPKTRRSMAKAGALSCIDAAAGVLEALGSGAAMTCKQIMQVLVERKLWASPNGKTPDATLHAAISREISTKGKDSRFKKAGRGLFAHA